MKSGITPTTVEAYQGAVGFSFPPRLPPPEDPPTERAEPPTEIDELVIKPPKETGLYL